MRTSALNYAEISHDLREYVLILVMQLLADCARPGPFTDNLETSPRLEVCGVTKMPSDEWIKTLADGRKVKFSHDGVVDAALITAQIEGNEVVYSILLSIAEDKLSREGVERRFERELAKR